MVVVAVVTSICKATKGNLCAEVEKAAESMLAVLWII